MEGEMSLVMHEMQKKNGPFAQLRVSEPEPNEPDIERVEGEIREHLKALADDRAQSEVFGVCERIASISYEGMMALCELLHATDGSKTREEYAALLFGVSKARLVQRIAQA
jgi:hypothetical protein